MEEIIYLDNAATTIYKPKIVMESVCNAMESFGNSGRGSYQVSMNASRIIFDTRKMIAELFQADGPEQVVFTANSTHALNIAIKGTLQAGDHVITTMMEHNSVLRPLYEMQRIGVEVTILPCDKSGNISLQQLQENIKRNTKAVVCTHASNVTGNINNIQKIGTICKQENILFILDASQTAGILPIHMRDMGIDIVCFTGHKGLMGPQGTGGLCVKKGIFVYSLYTGGSGFQSFSKSHPDVMPTALEAGTLNGHGIAGLHAALEFLQQTGINAYYEKEHHLAEKFYKGIRTVEGIKVYGDVTAPRVGIVAFNIKDYDSSEVSDELAERFGIQTRSGAHCAPLMHQNFKTEKQGIVRVSFGFFNTEDEVNSAISAVRTLATEED